MRGHCRGKMSICLSVRLSYDGILRWNSLLADVTIFILEQRHSILFFHTKHYSNIPRGNSVIRTQGWYLIWGSGGLPSRCVIIIKKMLRVFALNGKFIPKLTNFEWLWGLSHNPKATAVKFCVRVKPRLHEGADLGLLSLCQKIASRDVRLRGKFITKIESFTILNSLPMVSY